MQIKKIGDYQLITGHISETMLDKAKVTIIHWKAYFDGRYRQILCLSHGGDARLSVCPFVRPSTQWRSQVNNLSKGRVYNGDQARGAQAYNGGLGAEPQAGCKDTVPGQVL